MPIEKYRIGKGAVKSKELDPSIIQYAEVEITAAEILALFTTPKELVAAPGAGKILEFISAWLFLDFNTTPYTIGSATVLQVKETDADGVGVSQEELADGFLSESEDKLSSVMRLEASGYDHVANAPLVLTLAVANVTAGDSPIHVKVAYRVHKTGL